jgi:hypothetical protein
MECTECGAAMLGWARVGGTVHPKQLWNVDWSIHIAGTVLEACPVNGKWHRMLASPTREQG